MELKDFFSGFDRRYLAPKVCKPKRDLSAIAVMVFFIFLALALLVDIFIATPMVEAIQAGQTA